MESFKYISLNKRSNFFGKALAAAGVSLLLMIGMYSLSAPVKNLVYGFSAPLGKNIFAAGASSSGFINSLLNINSLAEANTSLQAENQRLISKILALQAVQGANEAQTEISFQAKGQDYSMQLAGVIGLDGQDVISINKGSGAGIAVGMPVVNQQNALVGKVEAVYKDFSQVMLVTNKKSVINMTIKELGSDGDETEVHGVLKGDGNFTIVADLIPIDSKINDGDVIFTSSLEKTFPTDFPIGTIIHIQRNDQKPFQQADVKPLFDLTHIDNLFVITNYKAVN